MVLAHFNDIFYTQDVEGPGGKAEEVSLRKLYEDVAISAPQFRVGVNLLLLWMPKMIEILEADPESEELDEEDDEEEVEEQKKDPDDRRKMPKTFKVALCEVLINGLWPEPMSCMIRKQDGLWKRSFHEKRVTNAIPREFPFFSLKFSLKSLNFFPLNFFLKISLKFDLRTLKSNPHSMYYLDF